MFSKLVSHFRGNFKLPNLKKLYIAVNRGNFFPKDLVFRELSISCYGANVSQLSTNPHQFILKLPLIKASFGFLYLVSYLGEVKFNTIIIK